MTLLLLPLLVAVVAAEPASLPAAELIAAIGSKAAAVSQRIATNQWPDRTQLNGLSTSL
jgi:hypothetical protein